MTPAEKRERVYRIILELDNAYIGDKIAIEKNIVEKSVLSYPEVDTILKWLKRHNLIKVAKVVFGLYVWSPVHPQMDMSFMCWEHGKMMIPKGKGLKFSLQCPICRERRKMI